MTKFFRNQLSVLLMGFVFWLPLAVTIYVLYFLLSNAERLGKGILELIFKDTPIHAGFGVALFIIIVYLSGLLLRSTRIRRMLSRIPVLGLFFGQGEIISISRLMHMQPCIFLLSPTCISYGWILSQEHVQLSEEKVSFPIINVYFPNVPTLVTGQVYAARKDTVIKLGNTSGEVINLLLYAFRSPLSLKYLPWEDESQEEFEKRSKLFGLK